ncbi:uncharacterized protein LOC134855377 [Symsagittifera roscoffensis]|uniref:uncharacterized protein LOC134855377 n=1 Tax=Symsagittifera roscoffensis TaxID=84072 RepID=UPI00307CAE5B
MADFFDHLRNTDWVNIDAWICACICPCYVFYKIGYSKLKEDFYRMLAVSFCPCTLAFWYMNALNKIQNNNVNKVLACAWTYFFTPCALYVAAADDGMKVKEELNACVDLLKKVVTIDRV